MNFAVSAPMPLLGLATIFACGIVYAATAAALLRWRGRGLPWLWAGAVGIGLAWAFREIRHAEVDPAFVALWTGTITLAAAAACGAASLAVGRSHARGASPAVQVALGSIVFVPACLLAVTAVFLAMMVRAPF